MLADIEPYRTEHCMILAPSGHGKTQLIQTFLASDLERVLRGECSVIVIDSQKDLIRTIAHLYIWRDNPERLVLIDPTTNDLALNLFNVGGSKQGDAAINALKETYSFIVNSVLTSSEFTGKQGLLFDMLILLLMEIPDATIHTFIDLLNETGFSKYKKYVQKLPPSPRMFFETEYLDKMRGKQYEQTRQEVSRRLWQILANPTFDRMFSQTETRIDLLTEMNAGRCILIDTDLNFFNAENSAIFGSFFVALLYQAIMSRSQGIPCYVFIDEAGDYLRHGGKQIDRLFRQARKRNVGITVAMQNLSNIKDIHDTITTNTAIKFAGGLGEDARAMAYLIGCDDVYLRRNKKGNYIIKSPGLKRRTPEGETRSIPWDAYQVEFGLFDHLPTLTEEERGMVDNVMRKRYGIRPRPVPKETDHTEAKEW